MAKRGGAVMAGRNTGGWLEILRTLVYAGLIAVGIRTIAFEPFNIPSGSMIPTLLVGDYLFVSKFAYGYSRHSLPFSPNIGEGRLFGRLPDRGDVAVFKFPGDNSTDYIKRIVGLPGDRIRVVGGVLNINGEPVKRELQGEYIADEGYRLRLRRFMETLPGGRTHEIVEISDDQPQDNTREFVVPADHLFAMGDNRDNSQDSRFPSVGFVPVDNLVGRAEILFFSTDGSARLWEVWKWPTAIRWSRLLNRVG